MAAIAPEIRDRTAQEYGRILKANVYPRIGTHGSPVLG
jgi:hypothetical protein